jgi:hypothetical protein
MSAWVTRNLTCPDRRAACPRCRGSGSGHGQEYEAAPLGPAASFVCRLPLFGPGPALGTRSSPPAGPKRPRSTAPRAISGSDRCAKTAGCIGRRGPSRPLRLRNRVFAALNRSWCPGVHPFFLRLPAGRAMPSAPGPGICRAPHRKALGQSRGSSQFCRSGSSCQEGTRSVC